MKFTVEYDVRLLGVSIEVDANSMEEALQKAAKLKHEDLFKALGIRDTSNILDSDIELMAIRK